MSLLSRFFYKRPPDGLLEFFDRVYVFDSCFLTEVVADDVYKFYLHEVLIELHEEFPDSSFLAFNFHGGEKRSQFAEMMCEYDVTVVEYPRQYESCPLLPLSLVQHFLRVSDSWLSVGNRQNIILLHCERGGWPLLAFLLAGMLIFRKLHNGERKTLEIVHREAPKGHLKLLSPLNPLPSQLRYLQYISRRNMSPEWPPPERALSLDCVILRVVPSFDSQNGCRPLIRIFGRNLLSKGGLSTQMLFSMPKTKKSLRHYRQVDCDVIKIDIQCLVQGDVVLECVHLDLDVERETMMFRIMFNTAFIRSNILILSSDNLDIMWDSKECYPKGFRAEVLFGEIEGVSPPKAPVSVLNGEDKGGLPLEAFSKVQELFSGVNWVDNSEDATMWLLKQLSVLSDAKELSKMHNHANLYMSSADSEEENTTSSAADSSDEAFEYVPKQKRVTRKPMMQYDFENDCDSEVINEDSEIDDPLHKEEQGPLDMEANPSQFVGSLSVAGLPELIPPAPAPPLPPPPPPGNFVSPNLGLLPPPPSPLPVSHVMQPPSPAVLPHTLSPPFSSSKEHTSQPQPPAPPPPPPFPISSSKIVPPGPYPSSLLSNLVLLSPSIPPPPPPPPPPLLSRSMQLSPSVQQQSVPPSLLSHPMQSSPSVLPPPPPPPPPIPSQQRMVKGTLVVPPPPPSSNPSMILAAHPPPPPPPLPPACHGVPNPPPPPPFPAKEAPKPPVPPPPPIYKTSGTPPPPIKPPVAPPPPPKPPGAPPSPPKPPGAPPPPPPRPPGAPPPPPPRPPGAPPPPPPRPPGAPPPPPPKPPGAPPPPPPKPPGAPPPPPPKPPGAPPPPPPKPPGAPPPPPKPPGIPPPPPKPPGTPPPPAPKLPGPPPPPPAVGARGSTVPPPPLPSASKGRSLSCSLGRSRPVGSAIPPKKASLKPLHWVKVTRATQGSLWADSQQQESQSRAPEIDISELESLFSAATSDGIGKKKGGLRRSNVSKPEKVQLVDLRRAYNCEIMLSKVKIPLPDMINAVLALDSSALDIDQVENLIKFCPTKEEIEKLKNYNGDKELLGKCEQFFSELMKVPRIESKLRVFAFAITFSSQVNDLRTNLNTINNASREVKESVKLRQIMQTILTLGNALNQGTARGSAVGFKLDSLLKLSDMRAQNNKMTLMHYLCKLLAEKMPELLDFPKDLVHLEPASKIQLKSLAEEMQAVSKGLEKVEQELAASDTDGTISASFQEELKRFLDTAEAEVRLLISLYSEVGRNADSLCQYFGEDPARCPFEQVTQILVVFVKMFNKSREENEKFADVEKKKQEKEAAKERPEATVLAVKR
ncbi:hypothetical protein MLD38_039083 [Melastoma candidum]|uniref:Uncharacterized protein n=1 Tax=Melastoma candidum TaxID=119954 RepID=A0ACB9L1U0_9MYRT|nr:hypothetical protein MLD38_039083 [Melastoma candidum]